MYTYSPWATYMIEDGLVIRRMAVEAYSLPKEEQHAKIRALKNWPSERSFRRLVPIVEACKKLKKKELAELVYMGFVLIAETEGRTLYPVRTFDFMTGLNSDHHVKIAKQDLEFLRTLKGDSAPLDSTRDL